MHTVPTPYAGDKGFRFLSTRRLVETLAEYKRLRGSSRDEALRRYAAACVREIRDELGRRSPKGRAA